MTQYKTPVKIYLQIGDQVHILNPYDFKINYFVDFSFTRCELSASYNGTSIITNVDISKLLDKKPESTYFCDEQYGDNVEFFVAGLRIICVVDKEFVGISVCNPKDKFNLDYGKLLSYTRAKEKQLCKS
jgi:hypothetical protein